MAARRFSVGTAERVWCDHIKCRVVAMGIGMLVVDDGRVVTMIIAVAIAILDIPHKGQ